MNRETLNSLDEVLDYLWEDEKKDWEANGEPEDHIFIHLKELVTLSQITHWVFDNHKDR